MTDRIESKVPEKVIRLYFTRMDALADHVRPMLSLDFVEQNVRHGV